MRKNLVKRSAALLMLALVLVLGMGNVHAQTSENLPVTVGTPASEVTHIENNDEATVLIPGDTVVPQENQDNDTGILIPVESPLEVAEELVIQPNKPQDPSVPEVPSTPLEPGEKELIIFHTNDMHGSVEQNEKNGNIGYATYKELVDTYKKQGKNVIVVDAGDATQGTNIASLSEGKDIIDIMNNMPVDAMTPGNHEFDYSKEQALANRDRSNFNWYASNIFDEKTGELVFKGAEVRRFGDVNVGIFGLTTPETKVKADPRNTQGFRFATSLEENVKIAQEEVNFLRAHGAELVLLLSHLGSDQESDVRSEDLVAKVNGIDVLIDGHSHTRWENGKLIKNTLLASTGDTLKNIGEVTVVLNDEGVVSKESRLIGYEEATKYGEDKTVADQIAKINEKQAVTQNVVIGKTATVLEGERNDVRTRETNLADLITDAMRKASGAQVVLTNGGGIRASIDEGDITVGEVFTVLPFGNAMTVIHVTGQDIIDAINYGVSDNPNAAGKFPHVSGLSYEIIHKADGAEATNILVDGKRIDPNATYELATNDFMAVGGDGYAMFEGKEQLRLYGSLAKIVENYIKELSQQNPNGFTYLTDGRISLYDGTEKPVEPTPGKEPPVDTGSKDPKNTQKDPAAGKTQTKTETKTSTAPAAKKSANPKTGDNMIYLPILLISALVFTAVSRKKTF